MEEYDATIARYLGPAGDVSDIELAGALIAKGDALSAIGHNQEAVGCFEQLLERFPDAEERNLRKKVVLAIGKKGVMLARLDRFVDADAAFDAWILGANEVPDVQRALEQRFDVIVRVLYARIRVLSDAGNKAIALLRLGRWEAAVAVDDELSTRFADATEPELTETVARALCNKAAALCKGQQIERSVDVWGEVVERYGEATSPPLRRLVARALSEKAELLMLTGRRDEAIGLAEEMIARAGDATDPQSMVLVARGLAAKGAALVAEDRYEEGIVVLNSLVDRFEDSAELGLRGQVALALVNKVLALERLGRIEEAERVQQDVLTRFGEEALSVFEAHTGHCENAPGPHGREQLASALYSQAWFLGALGRTEEALPMLTDIIERFEGEQNPTIQTAVARARAVREEIIAGESD
jgi:tetratricopeptide (TPR) repeat protein